MVMIRAYSPNCPPLKWLRYHLLVFPFYPLIPKKVKGGRGESQLRKFFAALLSCFVHEAPGSQAGRVGTSSFLLSGEMNIPENSYARITNRDKKDTCMYPIYKIDWSTKLLGSQGEMNIPVNVAKNSRVTLAQLNKNSKLGFTLPNQKDRQGIPGDLIKPPGIMSHDVTLSNLVPCGTRLPRCPGELSRRRDNLPQSKYDLVVLEPLTRIKVSQHCQTLLSDNKVSYRYDTLVHDAPKLLRCPDGEK